MEAVSVIIPAFNEEDGVADVIANIRLALTKARVKHEILLVDDGSKDQTALRAYQAGAQVISMGENRGYGASIKAGMRQAQYPLIAITDADGTYPAAELPILVQMTQNADMAVGARVKPGAAIPLVRAFPKWLLGQWANYLADRKIPDLNSGLRVFRKSIALRYEGLFPNRFSFTTTITLALECHGYIVKYRPIDYAPRVGRSKIHPVRDTINFFSLVLRVVMYFKPLKVFIPLSGILFAGALVNIFNAYLRGLTVLPGSTLFLLVSGVQVAALGLLADLLVKRGR
jgi:glycosyltransferase involved in cell wall biosynthesis